MLRALALSAAVCAALAVGVGVEPAAAQSSARFALDSRCDALSDLVPATTAVVKGDLSGARAHARTYRKLADRELVPRPVKAALRRLARFFDGARNQSIAERANALARIRSSVRAVVAYSAKVCSESATTTTTSRPLQ